MKKLSKLLSACAILALLIACAVFSASAETAVTPSDTTFTQTTTCPHCNKVVETWTPLTELGTTVVSESGHYVVEAGTTLTSTKTCSIGENASDVAILVIGNIDFTGGGHLRVGNQGTTTTWLIGGGGRIQGGNAPDSHYNPSLLGVYANGTLNIIGSLTIQGNETETITANRGGILNIYSTGKANMYGGVINAFQIDKSKSDKHAGVYVRSGGTFTMYGGTINGNSVENGGAIEISGTSSSVAMHGGTINGAKGAHRGCAVYISSGSFTMDNGTINGGTTTNTGGVFYLAGGSATISGTAIINGGTAGYGGVAYINAGSFSVTGGTINGGTASSYGGALYTKSTLQISGGTITGGSAGSGGVIGINGGTTTISGGTITGGTATTQGGTIYMHTSAGDVNITGGTITGGEAPNGGLLYMAAGNLTMTNGTISGGTARNDGSGSTTGHGGCIYIKAGTATFQGGTISGGKTVRVKDSNGDYQGGNGGTIYAATNVEIDGTTINGGTCRYGGVAYVSGCTLSLKSGTLNGGSVTSGAVFYLASSGKVNMTGGTVNNGTISSQGTLAYVGSGTVLNMTGGTMRSTVPGDESGIRVQGSGKVYLHGDAHVMASAGGRNAVDLVGTTSTPATLVLAGNARVSDVNGNQSNVHNITLQSYTSSGKTYYPKIQVANDWTGYATITDSFGSTASGDYICVVAETHYAQCGTWDAENLKFTQGGTFSSPNLTHGSADEGDLPIFGEDGKLMLPRAKAVIDGTTSWYRLSDEAADAASNTAGYAVVYADDASPITLTAEQQTYVDFNGSNVTITGEGTLYGMDSTALTTGEGAAVVTFEGDTVKTLAKHPATGEAYIAIKNGNTAVFHAVTASITSVSIRPSTVGMYYSAQFVCDDTIKNGYLDNFGIAVSLSAMPDESFDSVNTKCMYTQNEGVKLSNGEFNSVLIQNIMSNAQIAATNKSRGEMPIYANAYLRLTVDGEELTVLATSTSQFSLKTLLQEVNTYWDTFTETAQDSLAKNIYNPYVRNFEGDDWGIYNIRIKANGGYTAEEEAILAERRQTVMDYMRESVSLLWRSDKTLTYSLGNTERDKGKTFTIEAGRLYKGLPYVYGAGTQDAFLEYAGEPDQYGIYTISGIEATALNYESYGGRVGNDCSGAVTNAWSQISATLNGTTSSACHPYYGVVPVGNYNFNAPIDPNNNRLLDTKVVVESNGQQVMFEAYGKLQPADAAFHQEYPSTKGNHIRMVVSVHVVRNEDGTINGAQSYIIMLEQTRTLTTNNKTETHPETGETIYLIGGEDRKYTFNSLFNDHYIPVTIAELRDPSALEETWVDDTLEEDTIENLFTGSIITNRYLDSVRITIFNENGEVVQQTTGRRSRSVVKEYKMTRFLTEKPGSMSGTLNEETIAQLEPGNYRCTVTVKLTIDDGYVHTARDFTFSK